MFRNAWFNSILDGGFNHSVHRPAESPCLARSHRGPPGLREHPAKLAPGLFLTRSAWRVRSLSTSTRSRDRPPGAAWPGAGAACTEPDQCCHQALPPNASLSWLVTCGSPAVARAHSRQLLARREAITGTSPSFVSRSGVACHRTRTSWSLSAEGETRCIPCLNCARTAVRRSSAQR